MVKVDVDISTEIEIILAISEKDSLLKLKHVMHVFWLNYRIKFNNLKDDTIMNTVPSEEKEILWLRVVKSEEHRNDEEAFISMIKLGRYIL